MPVPMWEGTMPVRIFQGHDIEGIAGVEREINDWIAKLPAGSMVTHIDSTSFQPLNGAPIFVATVGYVEPDHAR